MASKTDEYTREERDRLWDIVMSIRQARVKSSKESIHPLISLSYIFRSGNILESTLLPDSAWALLEAPIEDMPLNINHRDIITAAIALWRLDLAR
jgi:hypothetical protein